MTYDDLKLDDRQILDVLAVARRERRDGDGPCRERRLHRMAHRAAAKRPAAPRRSSMRTRGRCWSSARRRIARSRLAELVDVPILIVHVSGRDAVEQIRWAQGRGLQVYARDLPAVPVPHRRGPRHATGYEGAKCVCSPPPRDKANQQVIWNGLDERRLHGVLVRPRAVSLRRPGRQEDRAASEVAFRHIPNGIPGLETRLPLLFSEGVLKDRIDAQHVRRTDGDQCRPRSTACIRARARSRSAADADLVIWDERSRVTITQRACCITTSTTRPTRA